MAKRNENKLSLIYDKRQKDFVAKYPEKCDGMFVASHILNDLLMWDMDKASDKEFFCFRSENFKEELERRGYDLTTLKFSIELKK